MAARRLIMTLYIRLSNAFASDYANANKELSAASRASANANANANANKEFSTARRANARAAPSGYVRYVNARPNAKSIFATLEEYVPGHYLLSGIEKPKAIPDEIRMEQRERRRKEKEKEKE